LGGLRRNRHEQHVTAKNSCAGHNHFGQHVADIIGLWSGLNDCTAGDSADITDTTTAYYCRNGTNGNEVHYYKIRDHNHIWPGMPAGKKGYFDKSGIDAAEVIWDFFSKY